MTQQASGFLWTSGSSHNFFILTFSITFLFSIFIDIFVFVSIRFDTFAIQKYQYILIFINDIPITNLNDVVW